MRSTTTTPLRPDAPYVSRTRATTPSARMFVCCLIRILITVPTAVENFILRAATSMERSTSSVVAATYSSTSAPSPSRSVQQAARAVALLQRHTPRVHGDMCSTTVRLSTTPRATPSDAHGAESLVWLTSIPRSELQPKSLHRALRLRAWTS